MQLRNEIPSLASRARLGVRTSQYGSPDIEQARCSSLKTKRRFGFEGPAAKGVGNACACGCRFIVCIYRDKKKPSHDGWALASKGA
ncbi:MAG TPA: hypothetical protein VF814_03795 [Casimicrobiaceae bacterium]